MDISQAKFALELNDYQNFSKAADSLYISQPTLSKQIRSLEKELGVRLFVRAKHGVRPTPEGAVFIESAQRICDEYLKMKRQIASMHRQSQQLTTGVFTAAPEYRLVRYLDKFSEENKQVELVIREIESDQLFEDAMAFNLDVIIAWKEIVPHGWVKVPLMEDSLMLLTSRCHPLATEVRSRAVYMSDAKNEPFILFNQPLFKKINLTACANAGFVPQIAHNVSHPETLIRMVEANKGVGLLFKVACDYFGCENICVIDVRDSLKTHLVVAFYDWRNSMSRRLADFMRQNYSM
jgi:DNA-binding transcriptional LysR family regulator